VLQSWESPLISHHAAPPGFHRALPPSNIPGRMPTRGKSLPQASSPFRIPAQGPHHSYFVCMFYLAYINIILLARSKSAATKMFKIKYKENTNPCRMPNSCDPAKFGLKRTNIEPTTLDFRPRAKRAGQLTRELIRLMVFPFQECTWLMRSETPDRR
jgi:hypothetical protein